MKCARMSVCVCVCGWVSGLIVVKPFWCFSDIAELKQKIHMLNLLILLLPEPNRNTLKVITQTQTSAHALTHRHAHSQHLHVLKQ